MEIKIQNSLYNNKLIRHRMSEARPKEFDEKISINESKNILNRPAQALSFSGSALSLAANAAGNEKIFTRINNAAGNAIVESKPINYLTDVVSENEALYNAVYSLIVAGVLKPVAVMHQKGEEKDKQMIAVKNFLQAFVGTFLTLTIGANVIKKIYDNIANNLKLIKFDSANNALKTVESDSKDALEVAKKIIIKESNTLGAKFAVAKEQFKNSDGLHKVTSFVKSIFKEVKVEPSEAAMSAKAKDLIANCQKNHLPVFEKNIDFVKILKENSDKASSFEACWKNSSGFITAIMKAGISKRLLPIVVTFLFAKKNLEMKRKEALQDIEKTGVTLTNSNNFKSKQQLFNLNSKHNTQNDKKQNNDNVESVPFKGKLADPVINVMTKGFEHASMSKAGQGAVNVLQKISDKLHSNPSAIMADFESIMLTLYWLISTKASDKIDPDQKLGLNVHTALVTVISTICAHLVDLTLDGALNSAKNIYENKIKTAACDIANAAKENLNKEALEQTFLSKCSKMFDAENIAKTMSGIDLKDTSAIETTAKSLAKDYSKKLRKFKSLTVFTLVVRFLVPVFTVNLSAKIKKKLVEYSKNKNMQKKQERTNEILASAKELASKQQKSA